MKDQELKEVEEFRSGFIAILGVPNVGKSTLMNAIMGHKVSIISPKPQTTRNKVLGIRNLPEAQLIFLDTPGVAKPKTKLNKAMQEAVSQALDGVDIVLLLVEVSEEAIIDQLKPLEKISTKSTPVFLVINKIDLVRKDKLLALIDAYQKLTPFSEIIPVSALKGDNIERLVELISEYLPIGPRYFPEGIVTDQPETFIMAEIIREKINLFTHQELPHTSAVVVDSLSHKGKNGRLLVAAASIFVERDSQKAIVIGKEGRMIKKIGEAARQELELVFGSKIFLDLRVGVKKGWTDSDKYLKEFGYIG